MSTTARATAFAILAATALVLATPRAGAAEPGADAGPQRGARMSVVEARYGAPTTRYAAVGAPPITRWDYPGFVVYFEHDRVIHAVKLAPTG